jgi:hypothetical protein
MSLNVRVTLLVTEGKHLKVLPRKLDIKKKTADGVDVISISF